MPPSTALDAVAGARSMVHAFSQRGTMQRFAQRPQCTSSTPLPPNFPCKTAVLDATNRGKTSIRPTATVTNQVASAAKVIRTTSSHRRRTARSCAWLVRIRCGNKKGVHLESHTKFRIRSFPAPLEVLCLPSIGNCKASPEPRTT